MTMQSLNKVARFTYYRMKPFLPRRLQIVLRRKHIALKCKKYTHCWPILREAGRPPDRWRGWPDGKRFALILTHDVDTARGQSRCRDLMHLELKMGLRSSINFVPERYAVSAELRHELECNGFEVGVHGLNHDGRLFQSKKIFEERAAKINRYLQQWNAVGFRAPAMHHNLKWIGALNIQYDLSTFDTDPFEPQPDGVGTIYPFRVEGKSPGNGYVEIPYTLPQDFTLFVLMREQDVGLWVKKLDWLAGAGGMVLVVTHPDYMNFNNGRLQADEYPADRYEAFLNYLQHRYAGQYWHVLPREMAAFWRNR
jgi:peptidoglycan/xylan/chitin deacetylase (PgdA/CDA1 family)